MGVSYRTAWISIDHLNSIADSPLVERMTGGVESIRKDSLNAIIELNIKGGDKLISQITLAGLESLGLRKGEEAYALIKANWISLENTWKSKKEKSLRDLKLEIGKAICVKFNASDVILGIAR